MLNCPFCRTAKPENDADMLAMIQARVEKKNPDAISHLGEKYFFGDLGVREDEAKAAEYYKKAAVEGHVQSRNNLGATEVKKGNYDRAVRHFMISAKMGHISSVKNIKMIFAEGGATEEKYTEALRGYQNAVEGMKSHDRDEAKRLGY